MGPALGAIGASGASAGVGATVMSAHAEDAAPVLSDRMSAAPVPSVTATRGHRGTATAGGGGRVGRVGHSGGGGGAEVAYVTITPADSDDDGAGGTGTGALAGLHRQRPVDGARPLFGADALRMLVAEGQGGEEEEEVKADPSVHVSRGEVGRVAGGGGGVRQDPLARARAARVAGPASRSGFSPANVPSPLPPAAGAGGDASPQGHDTWQAPTVPQARVGFGGPPVEGVLRNLAPHPHRVEGEDGVAPASGASTVVNPSTRRFLHRWAQQNLGGDGGGGGGGGARVDDDLDIIDDFDDELDF